MLSAFSEKMWGGRVVRWCRPGVEPRTRGWLGGAMVLGKLPVPGWPTIWIAVGQGPTALTVGAGGGCLDIFTLLYPFFPLSPSLWETARYRLKYCLKGPLNPKQPTIQPTQDLDLRARCPTDCATRPGTRQIERKNRRRGGKRISKSE